MGATEAKLWRAFEFDIRRKFARALAKGLVGEAGLIRDFATRLNDGFGNEADVVAAFSPVAADMRAALVASYESTVEARKVVASYRAGAGRLPGALGQALRSPTMAVATGHGISYIDRPLLDAEAKHWRRLNFGAQGDRVSAARANFQAPVYFDARILFYAGSEAGMRPPFALPAGHFIDPRSGQQVPHGANFKSSYSGQSPTTDRFFPGSGAPRLFMTGGIDPRHYIDAGFEVLANSFGPTLQGLYDKWIFQAQPTKTPPPLTIKA